jgi:hypothetical protein
MANKPNHKMQAWIDARKRHHLSHAQVQGQQKKDARRAAKQQRAMETA